MSVRRVAVAVVLVLALALVYAAPGSARSAGGGWHRIALTAPIEQTDLDRLTSAGATALRYWPRDSYLAWVADSDVAAVAAVPGVRRVDALTAGEKVHATLDRAGVRNALLVHVFAPSVGAVSQRLEQRWSVTASAPPSDGVVTLLVAAPLSAAPAIAALDEVVYVGPASGGLQALDEIGDQIVAGAIEGSQVALPGYEQWLADQGVDGSGVRVSIVDTGIDAHPDLGSRIKGRVNYSRSPAGEPTDIGGHGTHVAGIVGGDATGLPGVGRVRDGAGYLYGLGVAPKVEFVDQNAIATTSPSGLNCSGGWMPEGGWPVLTEDAIANGAHIWNASWRTCEGAGIGYVDSSRNLDQMVRDGDAAIPGDQGFTMVFAAGNAGANSGNASETSIEAPSEAKNTIVVAASANARGTLNPNNLAGFSSRGPAVDGRFLPTVTAPGQSVMSTRSRGGTTACAIPTTDSYGLYSSCSGTSMAAPHVTGAVALLTQWWRGLSGGVDPSPAMTKALLINSATDMAEPDIPNKDEGWGRVNLGTLFSTAVPRVTLDQTTLLTNPGDATSVRIAVADPTRPLKVSLVWTDAAAAAGAETALVNDLDLTVADDAGRQFLGNILVDGTSVAGGSADRLNNLENVFVANPASAYTVTVQAAALPGDGVPSAGDSTDQDYALVITNGTVVAE